MPYIGTSPSNGVRRVHTYTATASQTTFSGASSEGVTLSYADTNYIDVFQNGVLLGSADYTSTSGTSVVLAQAASVNDLIVIVVYDVFSVADTVSKTNGGSFDSGVTMSSTLGVTGALSGSSATFTTADNTDQLTLISTDADANRGPRLALTRNSGSPADNDVAGTIKFNAKNDAAEDIELFEINTTITDASDGTEDSKMTINGIIGGASTNRVNLTNTETVFNDDGVDLDFRVESDTKSHAFFMRGSDGNILINTDTDRDPPSHVTIEFEGGSYSALACQFTDNASGSGFFVARKADGATIGQIARNGTADSVQYLTTSDYRLKENVSYDFNATSQLKQLKPCTFTWKNDESKTTHQGFLAHEVQTILPHAINGKKDAVDDEGKIEAQSIDKGDLVPLLVKTIQELEARITALENAE